MEAVPRRGSFAVVNGKPVASVGVDPNDFKGVVRAVGDVRADVHRVTGLTPGRPQGCPIREGRQIHTGTTRGQISRNLPER